MTEERTPIEIFCSYAHEDKMWLRKLEKHLSLLTRQGLVSLWHDRLITSGTDRAEAIDTHLETASVILLLVSADFLASDYCYGTEIKRALAREAAGEARVIPILVRPVDWTIAPFAHLQSLPADAKPIASWQNTDAALADVAAGIRRVIVEELPHLTASAPHAALPAIWNIPYPRNPFFLGRDDELLHIRQNLQTGQTLAQPQAISGLGGIGKTQLALEYAYRYHQNYQAVLWARAESTEALISSYVALATLLRLPEREAKEQNIMVQAVKTWLQTRPDWLLILDNVNDLTLLPDFLPPSLGGHVLLTTRAAATGRLAQRLEIDTLPPEQGALFLLQRAALLASDAELSQALQEEQELALQISQELGGLPLALDQAGGYLEETQVDLASYWHIYKQHRSDLLHRRGGLVTDHPAPVATTWSISFQQVGEKNPAAADLLRLCAFLAPDAIAEELLTSGAGVLGPVLAPIVVNAFRFNQAIETLRAYSLVRRDPKEKLLLIHRLVQAVLKDELDEAALGIWAERAILAINAVFPKVEHATWSQCERLLPNALLAVQLIETNQISHPEAGQLLYRTASYLQNRARYHEAEALYQRALHIQEHALGLEHPEVATSLNGLATLYRTQGMYEQAEHFYQRALHIQEHILGPEHPDVATSLNGLATLYRTQGMYEQAEHFYQRALHIQEHILGPEHLQVTYPLNGLAALYRIQGEYEQAEQLYQRALHIRERIQGAEHPDVATSLNGLAAFYSEQHRYEQAELLYQRALHIQERVLGPNHTQVAYPLNGLATLYRIQGKYEQAEPLYQRALHIQEQALGPNHTQVAYPLNGLAALYSEQGLYDQAERLYQRALYIQEQALGSGHLQMAYPLNGLATLYCIQGKYEQAEPLYQQALHIRERTQGLEHFDVAYPLNGLATLYREQSKYEEAESLYQRALHIQERALDPEHFQLTSSLNGLAILYWQQGKYEQAEQLYQRALHIRVQVLGLQRRKTTEAMPDSVQFRDAQSNSEEIHTWYVRALAVRELLLGAHHPKTTEIRRRLISLLRAMGHHEEAAKLEANQSEL